MPASPRLLVEADLAPGTTVELDERRAHYLQNVLRLPPGAVVRAFNAAAGEWQASVERRGKRGAALVLGERLRAPAPEPGPVLWFAPVRQNRLDWLIEKAVELGVTRLVPVITRRTVVKLANPERRRAIAIEAAEQCERLSVPEIEPASPLPQRLARAEPGRPLLFADEAAGRAAGEEGDAAGTAVALLDALHRQPECDMLVGPEGGFDPAERVLLRGLPEVVPVTLGPRILRAETAALAMLACWQAVTSARGRSA